MLFFVVEGCYPQLPPCERCADNDDRDGDGFSPAAGDCDDADEAASPGRVERCNGRDDDCDGLVDQGAVDARILFVDEDGDGYGAGEPQALCDPGSGFSTTGDDCDDADADVNPGAVEICNDGLDANCDGSANGCVRTGEFQLGAADAVLASTVSGRRVGEGIARLGDLDADGRGDFVVNGVTGGGSLLRADGQAPVRDVALEDVALGAIFGSNVGGRFGAPVVAGPGWVATRESGFLGFGVADVYVFDAAFPTSGDLGTGLANATYSGEQLGAAMAASPEGGLLLSSGDADIAAYWLPSVTWGEQAIAAVSVPITGPTINAAAVGDLDGDGVSDLVVANSATSDGLALFAGRVWVFFGPLTETRSLDEADRVYTGPVAGASIGAVLQILPDLDGDGRPELAVAAGGAPDQAFVVDATSPSGFVDDAAWLDLIGPPDASFGAAFAAPDLDGDGQRELAVAAPTASRPAAGAGAVFVLTGPVEGGPVDVRGAALEIRGENAGDNAGTALLTTDYDGDGIDDLLIGAPGTRSRAEDGGAIFVWRGRGL